MKLSKSRLADSAEPIADQDREERQIALEYVAGAWNEAEDDGVSPLALAHASLFAAITSFVEHHGEQAAAALIEQLPERIAAGEYSLSRSLQ